jgi:hypothetical protein
MVIFDSVSVYPNRDKAIAAFKAVLHSGVTSHNLQAGDEAIEASAPPADPFSVKFVLVRVGKAISRLDFLSKASGTWDEAAVTTIAQEQATNLTSASR